MVSERGHGFVKLLPLATLICVQSSGCAVHEDSWETLHNVVMADFMAPNEQG